MKSTLQKRQERIDAALATFRKGIAELQVRRNALVATSLERLNQKQIEQIRKEIDTL